MQFYVSYLNPRTAFTRVGSGRLAAASYSGL